MADDETTNVRQASPLERLLSELPTAVHTQQQTPEQAAGKLPLAGYHGDAGGLRTWFGEANGCTIKFAAKAPEHGGPAEVFVHGIITPEVVGVRLVDRDGVTLADSVRVVEKVLPSAPEADVGDLMLWMRERIAEDRLRADLLAEDYTVTLDVEEVVDAVYDIANQRAVLTQCDADTLLLDRWAQARDEYEADGQTWDYESEVGRARTTALEEAVRIRALAYQHRPGYQEGWRP